MNKKVTKFFSKPLMVQNIKSNWILTLVIVSVMCMMCAVSTYSTSMMVTQKNDETLTEAQAANGVAILGIVTILIKAL